jgi:ABC-2 type transport system permease protein
MTSITVPTDTGTGTRTTTTGQQPPSTGATGASFATTAGGTARRTVLQFFRTPQLLMMGTIQGALFLFMFRYVFGGAISTGGEISYVDFLVPGFLVTTVLWTGMSAAAGVAEDSTTGLYDRLRSLPIPRSAVMLGRSLADTALVGWGLLVTGALGVAIGFRTHGSVAEVILAVVLILVYGFAVTWVFVYIGLASKNAQAAQGMSMLVIPFSFISSANVPISSMPGWMQPFAANQPITVMINAARSLMAGGTEVVGIDHTTTYWVVLSLLWCVAIVAVFGTLAVLRFSRTR